MQGVRDVTVQGGRSRDIVTVSAELNLLVLVTTGTGYLDIDLFLFPFVGGWSALPGEAKGEGTVYDSKD